MSEFEFFLDWAVHLRVLQFYRVSEPSRDLLEVIEVGLFFWVAEIVVLRQQLESFRHQSGIVQATIDLISVSNPAHKTRSMESLLVLLATSIQLPLHLSFKIDLLLLFRSVLLIELIERDLDALLGHFVASFLLIWEEKSKGNGSRVSS